MAVCGSNLTNYQVQLLKNLDVDEIVIAFDKDFEEIGDDRWKNQITLLKNINIKYSKYIQISFLWDKENNILSKKKSSPIDEGKEKFIELFKRRITL